MRGAKLFLFLGFFFCYLGFMAEKMFATRIDVELPKQVKRLSGDPEKPVSTLIEYALVEWLKKHDKPID